MKKGSGLVTVKLFETRTGHIYDWMGTVAIREEAPHGPEAIFFRDVPMVHVEEQFGFLEVKLSIASIGPSVMWNHRIECFQNIGLS